MTPDPLSEEKLAELEGLLKRATPGALTVNGPHHVAGAPRSRAYCIEGEIPEGSLTVASVTFLPDGPDGDDPAVCEADARSLAEARNALPSLLAEVRLGREALKALEDLHDGVMPALYDDEITANDPRSQARMVEHLRKMPALLRAASAILRKAGRR